MGKQPTNNRAIEPQLLHQFLFDNLSSSYSFPSEFEESFRSLSLNDFHRSRISGSLLETDAVMPGSSKCAFLLPSKSKRCILQSSDLRVLTKLFAKLHPNSSNIVVNSVYKKYSSIEFNGIAYGSSGNRPSAHPYVVLATWNESYFGPPRSALPDTISHPNSHERPINIHHYVTVAVTYNCISSDKQQCEQWNLAHASWFYPHSSRYVMGKPAELWYKGLFEAFGMHTYVPLDLLLARCAHGICTVNNESLLVVVPIV